MVKVNLDFVGHYLLFEYYWNLKSYNFFFYLKGLLYTSIHMHLCLCVCVWRGGGGGGIV